MLNLITSQSLEHCDSRIPTRTRTLATKLYTSAATRRWDCLTALCEYSCFALEILFHNCDGRRYGRSRRGSCGPTYSIKRWMSDLQAPESPLQSRAAQMFPLQAAQSAVPMANSSQHYRAEPDLRGWFIRESILERSRRRTRVRYGWSEPSPCVFGEFVRV